jgi:NAD-dependent dihydropyrimidine dehydrogenase PreA subunit
MDKAGIKQLVEKLQKEARVMAPHRREGREQWAFQEVTDPDLICLEYTTTTIPPKQFAFPPRETLVRVKLGGEALEAEAVTPAEPLVLFGVHPCDIYGLECLDTAYCDEHCDPNWVARRQQMRIVGVDCMPDHWCFCASMGTARVDSGYDLFLTPINGEYLVEVATEAGEKMLEGVTAREAEAGEVTQIKKQLAKKVDQERKINTDYHNLPLRFSGAANSEVWEKHAKRCYSCGTCILTCPTCYCFDVVDEVKLDLTETRRDRIWDGCMLEGFAKVASGENFRDERSQRLRHRHFRKYAYLFTKYGRPYCCGCGRCVRQCLAHIDPVEIINHLLEETEKGGVSRGA